MSLLEILPADIIATIVGEWIDDFRFVCGLDFAITNKIARENYFRALSTLRNKVLPIGAIISKESQMEKCAEWMSARHLHPEKLTLRVMSKRTESLLLGYFAPKLCSLKVEQIYVLASIPFEITLLTKLNFPVLNELHFNDVEITMNGPEEDNIGFEDLLPLTILRMDNCTCSYSALSDEESEGNIDDYEEYDEDDDEEEEEDVDDVVYSDVDDEDDEDEEDDDEIEDENEDDSTVELYFDDDEEQDPEYVACRYKGFENLFQYLICHCPRLEDLTFNSCEFIRHSSLLILLSKLPLLRRFRCTLENFDEFYDINSIRRLILANEKLNCLDTLSLSMRDYRSRCTLLVPILVTCTHPLHTLKFSTNNIHAWAFDLVLDWIAKYGGQLETLFYNVGIKSHKYATAEGVHRVIQACNTHCTELKRLLLGECSVKSNFLHDFRFEAFTQLEVLSLREIDNMDDTKLLEIGRVCQTLPHFSTMIINTCNSITMEGILNFLSVCTQLKCFGINLWHSNFTVKELSSSKSSDNSVIAIGNLFKHPTVRQLTKFCIKIRGSMNYSTKYLDHWNFDFPNLQSFMFCVSMRQNLSDDLIIEIWKRIILGCPQLQLLDYDEKVSVHTRKRLDQTLLSDLRRQLSNKRNQDLKMTLKLISTMGQPVKEDDHDNDDIFLPFLSPL